MEETKNPIRKPVRLKEYGYGTGVYFVTIVARDRQKIFSTITGSRQNVGAGYIRPEDVQNELTVIGNIAEQRLLEIPVHYPGVQIENYVIMPNHIHIILTLTPPSVLRIFPKHSAVTVKENGRVSRLYYPNGRGFSLDHYSAGSVKQQKNGVLNIFMCR